VPEARIEPERGGGWTRLLPLAALVLALFLVREAWTERGPRIVVMAAEGHGLRPGDPLRHLGIEVGEVEAVELAEPPSRGVGGGVRLARSAAVLARAGTRFWIARPVLGVEGVRGLETALGARYLALLPGPLDAPASDEFVALEEPPLFEREDPDALEILLAAEERSGLARGAPVLYRGLPIGTLLSVGLASDATAVEVHARIHGPYAELVRADSRFYRTRGVELGLGLGGVELTIDSLQSLWLGGVALATPTRPGPRAQPGQRFALASEPEKEWREWRPSLPVGGLGSKDSAPVLPARVHARLTWKKGGWFARERSRGGWLVRADGALLGPADLLERPEDAATAVLEIGAERMALEAPADWSDGSLARRVLPAADAARFEGCRRALERPEGLLVWADPALAPVALAPEQLAASAGAWAVDAAHAFDERWHGAPVAARADGCWLGILLVDEGRGRIVAVPGL
jgi:hypothetical protein